MKPRLELAPAPASEAQLHQAAETCGGPSADGIVSAMECLTRVLLVRVVRGDAPPWSRRDIGGIDDLRPGFDTGSRSPP
jgi:hypothetical protein